MNESQISFESGVRFIAQEAAYLDDRAWDAWIEMYAPNCEFWVPTWVDEETVADDPMQQLSHVYYSNRAGLEDRIARIRTGKSPASIPLRRTTHMHGNHTLVESGEGEPITIRTSWTCHVYDPGAKGTYMLFGAAFYTLQAVGERWQITKKKVIIQNDYLPSMIDIYCL